MCAIFGFLDYGKKVSHHVLTELLKELSIAAECRGTDATGISYVKDRKMVTFKKAKPAHKVNLYFPKGTTAVIGHTRFTTQGSEKHNYNNHPLKARLSMRASLWHITAYCIMTESSDMTSIFQQPKSKQTAT